MSFRNQNSAKAFVRVMANVRNFFLGKTQDGLLAGELAILAGKNEISNKLATPEFLKFYTVARGIESIYDSDGVIKQVLATETFVSIDVVNDFSYDIKFYKPGVIKERNNKTGLYSIESSAEPFVVWRVENPDGYGGYNKLNISAIKGRSEVYKYVYDNALNIWTLNKGNGLYIEKLAEEQSGRIRVVTRTITDSNSSNKIASQIQTTYKNYDLIGERVIQEINDPTDIRMPIGTFDVKNIVESENGKDLGWQDGYLTSHSSWYVEKYYIMFKWFEDVFFDCINKK